MVSRVRVEKALFTFKYYQGNYILKIESYQIPTQLRWIPDLWTEKNYAKHVNSKYSNNKGALNRTLHSTDERSNSRRNEQW